MTDGRTTATTTTADFPWDTEVRRTYDLGLHCPDGTVHWYASGFRDLLPDTEHEDGWDYIQSFCKRSREHAHEKVYREVLTTVSTSAPREWS